MPTKINIFKDTIKIQEAKGFDELLLFVIEQNPEIMLHQAIVFTSNKQQELYFYHYSFRGYNG